MDHFGNTRYPKNKKYKLIIIWMEYYLHEYSNEYNLSGLVSAISDLLKKIIIPDKKKIVWNSKSKIDT